MNKETSNKISEMLNPTESQKERMLENIMSISQNPNASKNSENTSKIPCSAGCAPYKTKHTRCLRYTVCIAAVLCLITTAAFASEILGLDIKFLEFLGPVNEEQGMYIASGSCVINKQIKTGSGTLNIKEAIGDSNYTLVFMEFEAPEGTVLDKAHYTFDITNIDYGGNSWAGYGVKSLPDDDPTDNKISMVLEFRTENTLADEKFSIYFENLAASDTFPGEKYNVLSGKWKGSFKLGFKNCSLDYTLNENVDMFGYSAVLKNISVSPISLTLKLQSKYSEEIADASGEWNYELKLSENDFDSDRFPITVNYIDGTSETTENFNGTSSIQHGSGDMIFIKTFDSMINDKEIKSITFFGTEIPLV